MSDDFASKVAELERELARVESTFYGAELERVRALLGAILEIHRIALTDLLTQLGEATLYEAATQQTSVAWLLACHDIDGGELEHAFASAERLERLQSPLKTTKDPDPGFVPLARLLHRGRAAAPSHAEPEPIA